MGRMSVPSNREHHYRNLRDRWDTAPELVYRETMAAIQYLGSWNIRKRHKCKHKWQLETVFRIRIHQSHMFLGLPDPDPDALVRGVDPIRILLSSFYHQARKTLILTILGLLLDFLSLKNDVNVHSKSNKQKTFLKQFFVCILRINDENSRIRIRVRMQLSEAWIRGSGSASTPKCHGSGTLVRNINIVCVSSVQWHCNEPALLWCGSGSGFSLRCGLFCASDRPHFIWF
jgi:hypothetical protein